MASNWLFFVDRGLNRYILPTVSHDLRVESRKNQRNDKIYEMETQMPAVAKEATESGDPNTTDVKTAERGYNEKERITLRLPAAVYGRLDELRIITHASNVNEVLKNALLFYDALVKERLRGNDVFVISADGEKTRYPVFL